MGGARRGRLGAGQLTGNTIAWPVWPLAARAPATMAVPLPVTETDWSPPPRSSSETGCGSASVPVSFQVPVLVSVATKTSPDSKAVPAVAVGAPNATMEPLADMPMFEPAAKAALVVLGGGRTSLASVEVPPDLGNTNAAPLRSLMPVWPAATIFPLLETATESPPPCSWAVRFQVLALAALVNTSVTPFWGSPNAIVEPSAEIAVSVPRRARDCDAGTVSFCART